MTGSRQHLGRAQCVVLACGALSSVGAVLASPARATVSSFALPGEQMFVVPQGVSTIHVDAVGGRGGKGRGNTTPGGLGARATADLAVTPGQVLYVEVAGNGGDGSNGTVGQAGVNGGGAGGAGAGGGGGGGGGASDIRVMPISAGASSLAERLIVAGGGGGSADSSTGAAGGAAGTDGSGSDGGKAGTSTAGGAGGVGNRASGSAGGLGAGGAGSDGGGTSGGGGGGGGYYGGGGGGSADTPDFVFGGGGGGSTAFGSGATGTSSAADTTGTPSVTLTYTEPPAISITTPADGAAYTQGQVVEAAFACAPAPGATLTSCTGPVANGAAVDTKTLGSHTFAVTAQDQDGGHATVTSTYTVDPVVLGTTTAGIARAHTSRTGAKTVSLRLACTGPAGAVCKDAARLTVVEHLVGRRVASVSATGRRRTVTVGSAAWTLSSGQSRLVTVKLNSTGKRLLARFRHLKVHLRVTQLTAKGRSKVVAHQTLTLTAPAKHR